MIRITNEKVAGFSPRWAPFRGVSLLFDNPGAPPRAAGRVVARIEGDVGADPALRLFRALADGLEAMGGARLTNEYLFCPLPPPSFHVTVWDGVNDGNVSNVHAERRLLWDRLLRELPASVPEAGRLPEIAGSVLVRAHRWSTRLRFDHLANWSDVSIVAVLAPADDEASRALGAMTEARAQLNADFERAVGVRATDHYVPHVTLGYFADRELGGGTRERVEEGTRIVRELSAGLTLSLETISLYGFTDMAQFYREIDPGGSQM